MIRSLATRAMAWVTVACCAGLAGIAPAPVAAAEPLLTYPELRKLYDDGQYQAVLQKIAPVLGLNGDAALAYDKVELLMLRGEALLQVKQQQSALSSFTEAAKVAVTPVAKPGGGKGKARKPEQVALAEATLLLVQRSPGFAYQPKGEAGAMPPAISLLDAGKRPAAFAALLKDYKGDLEAKTKTAAAGQAIPPILEAVQGLAEMRPVERVVTQGTKDADAMLAQLADRGLTLMSAETKQLTKKVNGLAKTAHEKTRVTNRDDNGNVTVLIGLRGLHPNERQDLEGYTATLEKIVYACRDFEHLGDKDLAAKFKALEDDAMTAGKKAHETLTDDYRKVTAVHGRG